MTPEEIQAIFFVECEESLASAEQGLAACKTGRHDSETVNAIFRAIHSIKGGAGAFGFAPLQSFTHIFETLLSDVREGIIPITPALVDLMLRAVDVLSDHVSAAQEGGDGPEDRALISELDAAIVHSSEHSAAVNATGPSTSSLPSALADLATPCAPERCLTNDTLDADIEFDLDALLDDIVESSSANSRPVIVDSVVDHTMRDGGQQQSDIQKLISSDEWVVHIRPHADAMRNGAEPLLLLRELGALGAHCLDCDSSVVPQLDEIDFQQGYLGWSFAVPASVTEATVRDIFDFVGDGCSLSFGANAPIPPVNIDIPPINIPSINARGQTQDALPAGKAQSSALVTPAAQPQASASNASGAGSANVSQSIRIDLAKLDKLIDTVGEMVIAQAMLAQRLQGENLMASEELTLLEGLTRDIQESAMGIRAQPIGSVFSRVPRILRELSASTGKQVKLVVSGESTELDKTVIERLGEPLTHLIRNAVDHGIESPEQRLAAGKNPEGTLTLSAEHRSGRIVIRVADDGAGINRARVIAKAAEKGIISADASLSKEEIDVLIFAPGFSTATEVTNVSGRGVGMDVVRQNVKELGGRITIESEEGHGTCFTMTLPLTLAISDGMIIKVGDQTLVVPLAHVVESLRPGVNDVQGLGANKRMLNVRGRFIPVVSVADEVGAENAVSQPHEGVLIVVETESAGQAALLVDNIWDQRQFVIKSLDTHYRSVDGVAGATILGDGRVALILDVDALVTRATVAMPNLALNNLAPIKSGATGLEPSAAIAARQAA